MTTSPKHTLTIRPATATDAETIRTIYAPYVTDTAITFEYDVPTTEEMARRMEKVQRKYPWLVATDAEGRTWGLKQ